MNGVSLTDVMRKKSTENKKRIPVRKNNKKKGKEKKEDTTPYISDIRKYMTGIVTLQS